MDGWDAATGYDYELGQAMLSNAGYPSYQSFLNSLGGKTDWSKVLGGVGGLLGGLSSLFGGAMGQGGGGRGVSVPSDLYSRYAEPAVRWSRWYPALKSAMDTLTLAQRGTVGKGKKQRTLPEEYAGGLQAGPIGKMTDIEKQTAKQATEFMGQYTPAALAQLQQLAKSGGYAQLPAEQGWVGSLGREGWQYFYPGSEIQAALGPYQQIRAMLPDQWARQAEQAMGGRLGLSGRRQVGAQELYQNMLAQILPQEAAIRQQAAQMRQTAAAQNLAAALQAMQERRAGGRAALEAIGAPGVLLPQMLQAQWAPRREQERVFQDWLSQQAAMIPIMEYIRSIPNPWEQNRVEALMRQFGKAAGGGGGGFNIGSLLSGLGSMAGGAAALLAL